MENKSFKINLTVVYNNDEITPEIISDQIWETMKNIGNGIIMLNVDSIKETKDSKKIIKKTIEEMKENDLDKNDEYISMNKTKKSKKTSKKTKKE
ncbi:MAG: hypothetical protein IKP65_05405 [Alphaproteobacteria bacterium]|nr:hypothetical protein [Alphaproteobacteria bacterium]